MSSTTHIHTHTHTPTLYHIAPHHVTPYTYVFVHVCAVRKRHSNAWPWTMILSGCQPWQRIGVARWLYAEYRRMEERRKRGPNDATRSTENTGSCSNEGHRPRRRRGHAGNIVLRSRRSLQDFRKLRWLKFSYTVKQQRISIDCLSVCLTGRKDFLCISKSILEKRSNKFYDLPWNRIKTKNHFPTSLAGRGWNIARARLVFHRLSH